MGATLDTLPLLYRGKGKDMYEIPGQPGHLLQVCRNTLSTHNVVHETEIPGKGALVASQTLFMHLRVFASLPTHIEEFGRDIYSMLPTGDYPLDLHHRAFVVERADRPEIEFVIRAYNAGSLAKALREADDPYGLGLPSDLPLMKRFDKPLLTPTEKSDTDGPLLTSDVRRDHARSAATAFEAFGLAQRYLSERDITLIDAKFELSGAMLIDDWVNGDCARLARSEEVREGEEPPFLDKERFRQIALRKWAGGRRIPLTFTDEEVAEGLSVYEEGFLLVTGSTIEEFKRDVLDC